MRPKLVAPALAIIAYSLYSLLAGDWLKPTQYINHWNSAAIVLYNMTWLSFLLTGAALLWVGCFRTAFRNYVEIIFQYWSLYILIVGVLFGNEWRVVNICNMPYGEVFSSGSDKFTEIDLVMLLVGIIVYLAIYAEMRLRRMIWVLVLPLVVYFVTAVVFGIPVPKIITDANGEPLAYELEGDRSEAWIISVSLLLVLAVALLGKFNQELLQRRNFIELELAEKRIEEREITLHAFEVDNQPHTHLEETHKRLKDAERRIEKVRLMALTDMKGNTEGWRLAFARELEKPLAVLRETDRMMTTLHDFEKRRALGPINQRTDPNAAERLVPVSIGTYSYEIVSLSPPSPVPIDAPLNIQSGDTESYFTEESGEDGPPLLPFNAAVRR